MPHVAAGSQNMISNAIEDRAVELLGSAAPVSKPVRKENLMSFREGNIFVSLKVVSEFDRQTQSYSDPFPKIVFMVDGKYVRMPVDSELMKGLGEFLVKLGTVLEDVEIPQKEIDMDNVRRKFERFREVVQ